MSEGRAAVWRVETSIVVVEAEGGNVRGCSYELSTWYSTLIPYLDLSLSYSHIAPPMLAYLCLVIIQMFHVVL